LSWVIKIGTCIFNSFSPLRYVGFMLFNKSHDTPPSSLLDPKQVQLCQSGSSWNLVPLPTSSTKGGKKGVLKAPKDKLI
jgi:hypothetical protein